MALSDGRSLAGMRLIILVVVLLVAPALAEAPSRGILLQATRNTRDLGGLPTANGVVRAKAVYRSGALCYLTAADTRKVNALKIATIVDLRNNREVMKEGPDRVKVTRVVVLPMTNSRGTGQEAYHYLIRENEVAVREFFRLLATPASYPLLFHCSAGKDRTGILTALLLMSLGTPREVIEDDYLQSQRNSPGLVVEKAWLQEVFDAVDYAGGIEAWLVGAGVDRDVQQRVRANLVTPAPR